MSACLECGANWAGISIYTHGPLASTRLVHDLLLSEKHADGMIGEQVPDDTAVALRDDDLGGAQVTEGLRNGGVVDPGGGRQVRDADRPGGLDAGQQGQAGGVRRVGSASSARCPARVRTDSGSPSAAMARKTRSASMTRWSARTAGTTCTIPVCQNL